MTDDEKAFDKWWNPEDHLLPGMKLSDCEDSDLYFLDKIKKHHSETFIAGRESLRKEWGDRLGEADDVIRFYANKSFYKCLMSNGRSPTLLEADSLDEDDFLIGTKARSYLSRYDINKVVVSNDINQEEHNK